MGFSLGKVKSGLKKGIGGSITGGFDGMGGIGTFSSLMSAPSTAGYERDINRGMAEIRKGFGPYAASGIPALEALKTGATAPGYTSNIQALLESTAPLRDQRRDVAEDYLKRSGISRSSAGADYVSDVDYETLANLEQMLYGRQGNIAGMGYGAATGQAENIANLLSARGAADFQSNQQQKQMQMDLLSNIISGGSRLAAGGA